MRRLRPEEVVMCPQITLVVSGDTETRKPEAWHLQLFLEHVEDDKGRADGFSLCQRKDADGILTMYSLNLEVKTGKSPPKI